MRECERLSIGLLLLFVVLSFSLSVSAEGDVNHAGLIILFDEGDAFTDCVTFDGEVTGYELLERAGLSVVVKDYGGGLGFAVCKIEDVGRDYPAESCFRTTDDISWRYWYREDGEWIYSGSGVSKRTVEDGDVEAWVWGGGDREPPDVDFAALCALPTEISVENSTRTPQAPLSQNENTKEPGVSPASTSTRTREVEGLAAGGKTSSIDTPTPDRMAMRIATSVARSRATPAPVSEKGGQRRDYGVFILLVAVLVVLIGYVTLLRRQGVRG